MTENFDEEGLLKVMEVSELAVKITNLTYKWDYQREPDKEAHALLDKVRRISLEISEYENRMGPKLSEYQRNKIFESMQDLEKLIPYMKNKIKAVESLENIGETN